METIEIAPLLDQLASKTSQLELLLVRRWAAQEAENKVAFFSVVGEIDLNVAGGQVREQTIE